MALENFVSPAFGTVNVMSVNEAKTESGKTQQRIVMDFAKVLSFRFVEDHAALARYQQFLSWRRIWLDAWAEPSPRLFTEFYRTSERFVPGSGLYWWDTRNFLVVAYTMGRSDLIPKDKAGLARCDDSTKELLNWIRENGPYLRPNVAAPIWFLDEQLKATGYRFVAFREDGRLPPPVYKATAPFPDWPAINVHRGAGRWTE